MNTGLVWLVRCCNGKLVCRQRRLLLKKRTGTNQNYIKWYWVRLLAGLGLYLLVLIPGILPHPVDTGVTIFSGLSMISVAAFGFDKAPVRRNLATMMIILSLVMLVVGIVLARQGHGYTLLLLSGPAVGLGVFGLRKLLNGRKNDD